MPMRVKEDEIELLAPASAGQGAAVRAVAVHLAAQEDLDLAVVSDLRLAVGEACEVLVGLAVPDSTLRCVFHAADGCVDVTMKVRTWVGPRGTERLRESVQWQAMGVLADDVRLSVDPGAGDGEHVLTAELASSRRY